MTMSRRTLLRDSAVMGGLAAITTMTGCATRASSAMQLAEHREPLPANPLTPPKEGSIPVAFVISEGIDMIDLCGPWEVFHQAASPIPFHLFSVGENRNPVKVMAGGMQLIADYTVHDAPQPKIVVIPAQFGTIGIVEWVRKVAPGADVTMSVCTGSDLLARTGLLAGKSATTHHGAYRQLAVDFPDIHVKRGVRFVEDGNIATAGGLSSGIDLALRVVQRYFGVEAAEKTAYQLEYQGTGWKNPESNAVYAKSRFSTPGHPVCPVCEMEVNAATAPQWTYKGETYYFMNEAHKKQFEENPEKYLGTM